MEPDLQLHPNLDLQRLGGDRNSGYYSYWLLLLPLSSFTFDVVISIDVSKYAMLLVHAYQHKHGCIDEYECKPQQHLSLPYLGHERTWLVV